MLKYLFTAEYKDGSIFHQNAEDKSSREPEKRSAFFDVRQEELKSFTLTGAGHSYKVDLSDGHFEVDGVPFRMHEEQDLSGFRIIFFRQHTHSFNQTREKTTEIAHDIVYRLGWQCTVKGQNYKQVMQID